MNSIFYCHREKSRELFHKVMALRIVFRSKPCKLSTNNKVSNISLFHDDSRFSDVSATSERCRYFRPGDKRAIFENMTDAGTLVIGK